MRSMLVFIAALIVALAFVLVLRRRNGDHGPHWGVTLLILAAAAGGAYACSSFLRTRDHATTMLALQKEPLVGAFMATPEGKAVVDDAVTKTAGLEGRERLDRLVEMTYPPLQQMVRTKLGALDDDTTVKVARIVATNLDVMVQQGRGCQFRTEQIALEDANGRPDLAIMVLRADGGHPMSRASRQEVDELMRPVWPDILARLGVASITDGDVIVQCRMGNMVLQALSGMPPREAAPAIRSVLRI